VSTVETPDWERLFARPVAPARDLITLRRGADEIVLLNGAEGAPVYLQEGGATAAALLERARLAPSLDALLGADPAAAPLVRLLLDAGVLVPADAPPPEVARPCACGAETCGGGREANLYLLLSQTCNMACTYCLAGAATYGGSKPRRMSAAVARAAVLRYLDALRPGGRLRVIFFGGEPLLNWPLARELMDWCHGELRARYPEREITFNLTSNLSLFPADLVDAAQAHGLTFLVDVDGPPAIHDRLRPMRGGGPSHRRIARNIDRLRRAGLRVSLRATVTSVNVARMLEVTRHHREIGGESSALVSMNPVDSDEHVFPESLYPDPERFAAGLRECLALGGWSAEELFPFNEYLGRVRGDRKAQACGAPYGNTPVVDSRGDVYPCIYWVGIGRLKLGNVADGPVYSNQALLGELFERLHVDHVPRCRDCRWRYLCAGGCPVKRVSLEGHPRATAAARAYAAAIDCRTSETVLEELLWREAGRAAAPARPSRGPI
jgi:uncharacterized protein